MSETIINTSHEATPTTHFREKMGYEMPNDYVELSKETSVKNTIKHPNNEDLREAYARLTFRLIEKIHSREKAGEPIDTVVFLDKSARPVAWMMKELWPLALNYEGVVPELPEIKFANVDRNQFKYDKDAPIKDLTPKGRETNYKGFTKKDAEGLHMVFAERPAREGENLLDVPTYLDGKRVMIIDEIEDTGFTLKVARELFREAFPDLIDEPITDHWMSTKKTSGQDENGNPVLVPDEIPSWYDSERNTGRLVDGTIYDKEHGPKNQNEKLTDESHKFLSTRNVDGKNRIRMSQQDKAKREKLLLDLARKKLSPEERRQLQKEVTLLEARHEGTGDMRGKRLRREMGKLALDLIKGRYVGGIERPNVEILDYVDSEEDYFAAARERNKGKDKRYKEQKRFYGL